jgi:hypothetical protein
VAHVLVVAALELCDPVLLVVLVEADDAAVDAQNLLSSSGAKSPWPVTSLRTWVMSPPWV